MAENQHGATVILSIDLAALSADAHAGHHFSDDHVVKSLAPLVVRHQLTATWGIADPASSPGLARLLAVAPEQEVALLGDAEAEIAARAPLARRLVAAAGHAQELGYALATIALRQSQLGDDWRAVVRQGINAVSGATVGDETSTQRAAVARRKSTAPCLTAPRAIRYGLWEFPTERCFAGKATLWSLATSCLRARQVVDRAIASGGTAHLLLDGPGYCAAESRTQRWFARLLEHIARRRDQGRLEVQTVSDAALRLLQTPNVEPARSILRDAA